MQFPAIRVRLQMQTWQISHNSLYTRGGGAQGGGGSRRASARTEPGVVVGRACARPTGTMKTSTTGLVRCYGTTIRAIPTAGCPSLHAVSENSLRPRDPGEGPRIARPARTVVSTDSVTILSSSLGTAAGITEHPLQARNKTAGVLCVPHLARRTGDM
mgnify:CR=1 FL=1